MPKRPNPTRAYLTRRLAQVEPRTADQLHRFVRIAMGLNVPRTAIVPGSSAPFDYLSHVFFEHAPAPNGAAGKDAVVWANRGGGKTMLGAVATLLDMMFKPGVQVRILGGSLEQSSRMYEHLVALLGRPGFRCLLESEPTQRRVALVNGSRAELLAGSQRSVRGVRVHKLRCDEIEEFDNDVWEAAQLVTRSGPCGGRHVHGAVEALSTLHRPFGLMARLVEPASQGGSGASRLFKWTAMDVIEQCEPDRPCDGCPLWDDCQGKAKHAHGFIPVDDLIQQWRRSSRRTWASEMMCRQPELRDCVYPEFDPQRHVRQSVNAPDKDEQWIGGMDFGLRSPTVMLWARVLNNPHDPDRPIVHVVDEYVRAGVTLDQHLRAIDGRSAMHGLARPDWIGVDPAGNQRNSHSGLSDVQALRRAGFRVRSRKSYLKDGIECIRQRLDHDTLFIHPRCVGLCEALRTYHFDVERPRNQDPVKDGPDHACDALRYMIVNLESDPGKTRMKNYLRPVPGTRPVRI